MIILIWLTVLVVCLIFMTALGLSFTPKLTMPTLHWWADPMCNNLRAYLKKQLDDRDFTIHYYMGGGLGGQTSFYLLGDGSYELWSTVTKGHERKIYSGQVPLSQVEQVVEQMLAVKIWRIHHDSSTRLDDPKAIVSVKARGKKSIVMLWVSEIKESPSFALVQRELLAIIREVSQAEVLESGWGTGSLFDRAEVEHRAGIGRKFSFLASLVKRVKRQPISLKSDLRQRGETSER